MDAAIFMKALDEAQTGFAAVEPLNDSNGIPVDFVIVHANPWFYHLISGAYLPKSTEETNLTKTSIPENNTVPTVMSQDISELVPGVSATEKVEISPTLKMQLTTIEKISEIAKETFLKRLQELIENKESSSGIYTQAGSDKVLEIKTARMDATCYSILIQDQTEKYQNEKRLNQIHKTYQNIFNNTTQAIYIQAPDGKFLDVNEGALHMYKCNKEYLIGKTPADVSAPGKNDLELIKRYSEQVLNDGKTKTFEFWGVRSNGHVFPKEVILNRGEYFDQTVMIAMARDISLRKKNELEVLNQSKLQGLLATISTELITARQDNFSDKCMWLLESICTFFEMDRAYIFEIVENNNFLNMTYEWCVPDVESRFAHFQHIDIQCIPSFQKIVQHKDMMYISDVEKLTDNHDIKLELNKQKLRTVLNIPLIQNQELLGYIGLDKAEKPKEINKHQIDLLKILSNILADTLTRLRIEEKIKIANEEIHKNEQRFRAISENTSDGIIVINGENIIEYVSPSFLSLTGKKQEEVFLKDASTLQEAVYEEDKAELFDKLSNAVHNKEQSLKYSYRIIKNQGEIRWREDHAKFIYTKDGIFDGCYIVCRDNTETKENEEKLAYSTQLKELLLKMSNKFINISYTDLEQELQNALQEIGLFLKADRVYVFKFDWAAETFTNTLEWCNVGISKQIHRLQNLPLDLLPQRGNEHKQNIPLVIEDVKDLKEGSTERELLESQQVISLINIPIIDGNDCLGFVGLDSVRKKHVYTAEEIEIMQAFGNLIKNAEKKSALEQKLIQEREKADSASKYKSEFLANMSHEIRTPLNGVIGFTDLLMKTPLNPIQKQYAENISTSGKSLLGVINDILDFSKIEAGKLELEPIHTSLTELVEHSIDIIKYHAAQKGLELLLNLSPKLPQIAEVDPVRLKQILINLLNNAVKFTHEGEVELKVTFEPINQQFGYFTFSVRDTGIGIKDEEKDKLFKAFSQADSSTTRRFGGTGLGLAISNLLALKMGDGITMESTYGKGSIFSFTIKAGYGFHFNTEIKINDIIKRAIVIDDNANNRTIIEHNFNHWGIEYTGFDNSFDALKHLEYENNFDVAIIDYHMPYMDGLETIKMIREKLRLSPEKLPIILIHSTTDDQTIRDKCKKYAVRYNLLKPVKATELLDYLKNITLHKDEQGNDEVNNVNEKQQEKPVISTKKKILIAEDVPMNLLLVKSLLSKLAPHADILTAQNGLEAVDIVSKERVDLILMDVQMPKMDGLQATRTIRQWQKNKGVDHIPIVAVTAGALPEEKENCLKSGMDYFLAKPIEVKSLESIVNVYLPNNNITN